MLDARVKKLKETIEIYKTYIERENLIGLPISDEIISTIPKPKKEVVSDIFNRTNLTYKKAIFYLPYIVQIWTAQTNSKKECHNQSN